MTKAHAERRTRLNLPEPDAEHECRATEGEKEQACYGGQWTLHGPHDYECRRANWRGGGIVQVHCPGKTPETILGPGAGGRLVTEPEGRMSAEQWNNRPTTGWEG